MKRDDLAARLAEHQDYVSDDDSSGILCAGCLARLGPDGDSHKGSLSGLAAHQADVGLAWFQEQTTEEWAVRYESHDLSPRMDNPSGEVTRTQVVSNEGHARAAVKNGAPISARNRRVVSRRVTAWEEA